MKLPNSTWTVWHKELRGIEKISMSDIKILIACHKDTALLDSKILTPIHVGAAKADRRFEQMLSDDTGDQISAKNPMYCELTAQYWAWKNLEADYYGLQILKFFRTKISGRSLGKCAGRYIL